MITNEGRVQAAFDSGVFVLKLCGDVRLTLCATLDTQAQQLARTPGLQSLIIDLREATNVDSTALGFLAKVAMAVKDRILYKPTIVVNNPDVQRMLEVMGFAQYFAMVEAPLTEACELSDLPEVPADMEEMRLRILEAHRILMRMSEHNREEFQPLVEMLEAQETSHSDKH
ncbi:STAS domain-containing protein [Halomonas sp. MCCC 1A17488]|uniref:STAS domain-containing protein n=1 Tax=Billgrantia sulfidoxydans TaxID=2733484 RepID=A0ABX7W4F8_9GAMM|nr:MULTISPECIES: STAS domain-containing protein [Halomonas]MCE8015712.1 STAS domain-containing protein [Halomonas sp. MCCC 1A17488]MCG3239045.1 STAS domain-containing protein [Halomonas sp. MCCC 1A17488]QPP51005.1 STAS domain-containing protein [Halomonas sp. SS10-MC5]QTP54517.1 STAS domain-containing protein [Halomonas sulfidoxydans]